MKKFAKIMAVVLVAVMAVALLVSCGPASDPDKAVAALKSNGYSNAIKLGADGYSFNGLKAVVTASKGLLGSLLGGEEFQTITIYYFESTQAANDNYDAIQSKSNSDSNKKDSDWVFGQNGAMIYYGTSQAVKDAR